MEKLKTNELSLGLNQTFRNDLVDNFEKIQKGVDGQSDTLNKQITDLLGDVAPQDQNEVTQARIDGNGKLYNTLKGRSDATQATAETALSEERDTSAEVQDARTNSSSKTYPTLKARMNSQENDLNNSINNKLSQISSVPETFTNLDAIKAKYPNGKNGLMIAADNGHKYIWANSKWTDAGVYQSQGIAPGSISNAMLGLGVVKHDNIADQQIDKFKLANDAVITEKISDGAVIGKKIAIGTVATENLQDNSVTTYKVQDHSLIHGKYNKHSVFGDDLREEGRPGWAYSEQLNYDEPMLIINSADNTVGWNPKCKTLAFFWGNKKILTTTTSEITIDTELLDYLPTQAIYIFLNPENKTLYLGKFHNVTDGEKVIDCVSFGIAFPPYMGDKSWNTLSIELDGVFVGNIKHRQFGGNGYLINEFNNKVKADWDNSKLIIPEGTKTVYMHPTGFKQHKNSDGSISKEKIELPFDGNIQFQVILYNFRKDEFKLLRMTYTVDYRYSDYIAIGIVDLFNKKLVIYGDENRDKSSNGYLSTIDSKKSRINWESKQLIIPSGEKFVASGESGLSYLLDSDGNREVKQIVLPFIEGENFHYLYFDKNSGSLIFKKSSYLGTPVVADLVYLGYINSFSKSYDLNLAATENGIQSIGFLGDSITFGYNPENNGKQMSNPWVNQVGSSLGFETINNYGVSSSTISTKASDPDWDVKRNPMVNRVAGMDESLDLIGVLGGINDFWLNVPLGKFEDRTSETFYGALHILYSSLAGKYAGKRLFIITCLDSSVKNPSGVSLSDWVKAQRDVATYYSIPIFDLNTESGISTKIEAQKNLIPDGLHPSQQGADIIGGKITAFIKSNFGY